REDVQTRNILDPWGAVASASSWTLGPQGCCGVNAQRLRRTLLRCQPRAAWHSEEIGIGTCTPTMRPQERSSGRRACQLPLRAFQSRIWQKENSTLRCPRELAAEAGPR